MIDSLFVHPAETEAPSETELVESAYRRHRDRVYRLALRYGGGRAAWAEDVTQDAFIRLWRHVGRLRQPEAVEGWLYRVTSNLCLNRLQRERILHAARFRWPLAEASDDRLEGRIAARSELSRAMQVVAGLPPRQQLAFCMYHLDGKEQAEIGEILGHSKGYVSKLIAKAEQKIRKAGWRVDGA